MRPTSATSPGGLLVVARVGAQEHRTPASVGLESYWSQGNHFTFNVAGETFLELEVMSSDGGTFGKTSVDLRSLPPTEWLRRREPLGGGGGGELEFDALLELEFDVLLDPQ